MHLGLSSRIRAHLVRAALGQVQRLIGARLVGPFIAIQVALSIASKTLGAASFPLDIDVYAGGLHVVSGRAQVELEHETYAIDVDLELVGLISIFVPWESRVHADGKRSQSLIEPRNYIARSGESDDLDYRHMTRENGIWRVVEANPPAIHSGGWLGHSLTEGAVDPLSALIALIAAFDIGRDCVDVVPVYDGKRRFDLAARMVGKAVLKPGRLSRFSGSALVCDVEVRRIAGFDSERGAGSWFWRGDGRGTEPLRVWIARLRADLPPLPVKAKVSSRFGTVVAHFKHADGR